MFIIADECRCSGAGYYLVGEDGRIVNDGQWRANEEATLLLCICASNIRTAPPVFDFQADSILTSRVA